MKTAMQELIDLMINHGNDHWLEQAEELLEKEKQQIIEAYDIGDTTPLLISGEEYYNKTFNS